MCMTIYATENETWKGTLPKTNLTTTHHVRGSRVEHPNACIPSFLVDTRLQLTSQLIVGYQLQVLQLQRRNSVKCLDQWPSQGSCSRQEERNLDIDAFHQTFHPCPTTTTDTSSGSLVTCDAEKLILATIVLLKMLRTPTT